MTVQQLKYILKVAEVGSITEAAKLLFISQPSLSNSIKETEKEAGGTHYIKKVSHRTLIFQVLCCFLLFLLHFCHMALEACFHIFGVKRFDDTNTIVINVDNLIPLAVKIAGG